MGSSERWDEGGDDGWGEYVGDDTSDWFREYGDTARGSFRKIKRPEEDKEDGAGG
jgi:hypothetical protein